MLPDAEDPRLTARPSTLVARGELTTGDPDRWQRSVRAAAVAGRWLERPALRALVEVFGDDLDAVRAQPPGDLDTVPGSNPVERLPPWLPDLLTGAGPLSGEPAAVVELLRATLALEKWAGPRFNFRGGATYVERSQAASGDFTDAEATAVRRCADGLQLRRATRPREDGYDNTLVLGAGGRSPLLRSRYAVLWAAEGVDVGRLHFLGSARALTTEPPERETTDAYAPGARDEFDLMVAAAAQEFGWRPDLPRLVCGCASVDDVCPRWPFRGAVAARTPTVLTHERAAQLRDAAGVDRGVALSARTGRPPIRPDTADTLDAWARHVSPSTGIRTLAVTTPRFVPFQTFDCLKVLYLDHGVDVDVIGNSFEWHDRPDTPGALLQETLSGIRSARRLLLAAIAPSVR